MARLAITVQEPAGFWPALPLTANAEDFTWTASGADFADGFSFTNTGRELILIRNDNVGAQTITVSSVVDRFNRTGDITTYSIGAAEYAWFGPFKQDGWNQSGTQLLYAAVTAADLYICVVRLPVLD